MRALAALFLQGSRKLALTQLHRTATVVHASTAHCMSRLPRRFVASPDAHIGTLAASPTTVITYNLLAQKYIDDGAHAYCPPDHSSWASRWPKFERELKQYDADILCLQEVEVPVFKHYLVPTLEAQGMQGLHRPRGGKGEPPEGVAFFYSTTCFDCLTSRVFGFGDKAPEQEGFWSYVRKRPEGAILALLRHKQTGNIILAEWPDIKLAQAAALCEEAADMMTTEGLAPANVPVILGGDWNSLWRKYTPDQWDTKIPKEGFLTSGVCHLFQHGLVDSTHHEHPAEKHHAFADTAQQQFSTCGLQLRSAYAEGNDQQEPPVTTQTDYFKGCLDYVFVSAAHWAVTHTLSMPYEVKQGRVPQAEGFGPIPDSGFPSDHLAMGCKVVLK